MTNIKKKPRSIPSVRVAVDLPITMDDSLESAAYRHGVTKRKILIDALALHLPTLKGKPERVNA